MHYSSIYFLSKYVLFRGALVNAVSGQIRAWNCFAYCFLGNWDFSESKTWKEANLGKAVSFINISI